MLCAPQTHARCVRQTNNQEWTGEATIGDAVLEVARRLPNAKVVITTRGVKGSVLLRRAQEGEQVRALGAARCQPLLCTSLNPIL